MSFSARIQVGEAASLTGPVFGDDIIHAARGMVTIVPASWVGHYARRVMFVRAA